VTNNELDKEKSGKKTRKDIKYEIDNEEENIKDFSHL
jgi:hypothetical protein